MSYIVQKGDSLWKIARNQGLTSNAEIAKAVKLLQQNNNIKDANKIFIGQKLELGDIFGKKEAAAAADIQPEQPAENAGQEQTPTLADNFNKWVDKNTTAMDEYIAGLDKLDPLIHGDITYEELMQGQADLENTYNNTVKEIGAFNFIGENIDIINEDGYTDSKIYLPKSGEFAASLAQNWEKDNEEGISFEEYHEAEVARMNGLEVDETAEELIKQAFDMMDLDSNGVIETDEIQSVYSAIDNADGQLDGSINFETYGAVLDSQESSDYIQQQAIIFKEQFLNTEK